MSAARFITLEGIDGAGKSTHIPWIAEQLESHGISVCLTREPGGTPLGERLRQILLDPGQQVEAAVEALLMFAARKQHLVQIIEPALARGQWVLCDRFTDATFAYQGCGRGLPMDRLAMLEDWLQAGRQPDLTLYFDLPIDVARTRLLANRTLDRFEQEHAAFFERVRRGYLDRASRFPQRIRVMDSTQSVAALQQQLVTILAELAQRP
ncbi:MAG: dTMP kinase [Burkholderiales bacterium]|nr:dTMP kinase [Burkholderiales bacterium]